MVLTLRRFRVAAAFDELDSIKDDGLGWPRDVGGRGGHALGDEAYQILRATAKPRQGMPVRVTLRDRDGKGAEGAHQ